MTKLHDLLCIQTKSFLHLYTSFSFQEVQCSFASCAKFIVYVFLSINHGKLTCNQFCYEGFAHS